MGTDYVELLDRRTAEVIIRGNETDLIAVVESRTRPMTGPPVWRNYWDTDRQTLLEYPRKTAAEDRLKLIMSGGIGMEAIKVDLIRELCTSDWLHLDYWGCMSGVFESIDPPGSTKWEDFISPVFPHRAPVPPFHHRDDGSVLWIETSGRYLLTSANTNAMILSLRKHSRDLQVMCDADIVKLATRTFASFIKSTTDDAS